MARGWGRYPALALGLLAGLFLGLPSLAATPPGKKQAPRPEVRIPIPGGGEVLLTDTAVSCSRAGQALWSREAYRPDLPLLFEDAEGTPLLLFFEADRDLQQGIFFQTDAAAGRDLGTSNTWGHAVLRAVEVETGKPRWVHDFYGPGLFETGASYTPVTPVFVRPWIYFGRACYLDRLDPDTGAISGRLTAWESIKSITPLPEGESLSVELSFNTEPKRWLLTYRGGTFLNPLPACDGFASSLFLFRFATYCALDFYGATRDRDYSGYLDLHRFKRVPMPPGFVQRWEGFDLAPSERVLRDMGRQDPFNPYLPLLLALNLKCQGRDAEAQGAFQAVLECPFSTWHEDFWMGRLCEDLGLVLWADALYARGTAAYFEAREAPPEAVTLIEVLVHFPAQRMASLLFANGHSDRALRLVELRRQVYPFTEGDPHFSRLYAAWLRDVGQELQAREEETRAASAARRGTVAGFLDPWPWWFKGWLPWLWALLLLLTLTIYRAFGGWNTALAVPVVLLMLAVQPLLKEMLAGGLLFLGFALLLTFFGVRREFGAALASAGRDWPRFGAMVRDAAFWATAARSPLVWLVLCFSGAAVAASGESEIDPWSGAWVVLLLPLGALARWGRKRLQQAGLAPPPRPLRRWIHFAGALLLLWLVAATLAWNIAFIGVLATRPLTSDLGHPAWQHRFLRPGPTPQAAFTTPNGGFAAALVLHLGFAPEDPRREEARRLYWTLAEGSRPDARALNNLGAMEADAAKALALFERAVAADPRCAPALYNLGRLKGDPTLMERARALDPWRVQVFQAYRPARPMVASLTTLELARSQMPVGRLGMLAACANPYRIAGQASVFQMMWGIQ